MKGSNKELVITIIQDKNRLTTINISKNISSLLTSFIAYICIIFLYIKSYYVIIFVMILLS